MDLSGQTLGKYKLIRRLGKGGMAEVYLAKQPTIERMVAVKVLHRHLADNEDFILRFKREARSLGQLQHPNIVRVIDFDGQNDVYYMVMDFIAGPTLRAYLEEKERLSDAEALFILAQLVEGLAYAHQAGAVHRDIKPGNVMFTDETCKTAVITDFGITRLVNDQTITMEGSMVGTPAYMSPEAVLGEKVDGRADIYSLGVILYEMVTGRTPYEGATPLSMVVKQVHEPLPSPLEFRPDLSIPMVRLIEKALSKEINTRFQTAAEFLQAIHKVQADKGLAQEKLTMANPTLSAHDTVPVGDGPTAVAEASAPPPATVSQPNNNKMPLVFAAGGLLLIAVVAALLFFRGRDNVETIPPSESPSAVEETAVVALAATETAVVVLVEAEPSETPVIETAEPDPAPQPAPTATPVPIETVLPQIEPNRTGTLQIGVDAQNNFKLQIDRVPLPALDTHYELWLVGADNRLMNAGIVPVENQRISLEGAVGPSILTQFNRMFITQEADDAANPSNPGKIVFAGQFEPGILANLQQLLSEAEETPGTVINAIRQLNLAQQHAQLGLEALESDDLAAAKLHMEHMINILDGETGDFFGDINLDGQAQNPGDGIGVRVYLEESQTLLSQLGTSPPQTAERQFLAAQAETAAAAALETIKSMKQRAGALAATDTVAEAQPIADEITVLVNTAVAQHVDVYQRSILLAQLPVFYRAGALTAPDPIVGTVEGQFGLLELFDQSDAPATGFYLTIAQLPPLPLDQTYRLWLFSSDLGQSRLIGEFNSALGRVERQGAIENNILRTFDELLITVESIESDDNTEPGPVQFRAQLRTPLAVEVLSLLLESNETGKGALFGAEEQTAIAVQHFSFAQGEIQAGNLAGAKVHLEHVINILDGRTGASFGDLNGDGLSQNPGDDVGVRVYWEQSLNTFEMLDDAAPLTGNQQFVQAQLAAIAQSNLDTIADLINQASKVLAADTVSEAQPLMDSAQLLTDQLAAGKDSDDNGVIDPLFGEGSFDTAQAMVLQLVQVPILAESSPQAAKPDSAVFRLASAGVTFEPAATAFLSLCIFNEEKKE